MKEAQMQTMFGKWLQKEMPLPAAYELKIEKGKSFAFNKVKDHQIEALLKVKKEGLYHKIADNPIFAGKQTRFHAKKPFDCVYLRGGAYIVLWYYVPRQPKYAYIMDIEKYLDMVKKHPRKSVRAEELDEYIKTKKHKFIKVKFA